MTLSLVRRAAMALAVSLLLLQSVLTAQTTGTIRGRVTDASNGRAL